MKIRSAVLAVLLTAGGLVGVAVPAQAASYPNCTGYAYTGSEYHALVPGNWDADTTKCVLGKGNQGSAVKALQRSLNYCYGAGLSVDSVYGTATASAIKSVQRKLGVTADGVYGPSTGSRMNHAWYTWDGHFDHCAKVALH